MSGARASIIGRRRPLPGHQRAHCGYTLNCEEPLKPNTCHTFEPSASSTRSRSFASRQAAPSPHP
ncbi:hypothetical protein DKM19_12730 [Streptosporangium sp. 'caverna']|nr:hypothetical protein DKM19_12730 [Streptosporangium sp. 'caverna']